MKLAIFGSYNGTSIGDTAILLGLLASLRRTWGPGVEITVLTFGNVDVNRELDMMGIDLVVEEIDIRKTNASRFPFLRLARSAIGKAAKRLIRPSVIDERKVAGILTRQDLLLIGGGNLLMDLFPAWPKMLRQVSQAAGKVGVAYCLVGVGAAPIGTKAGRRAISACLHGARRVYFRDCASRDYCESLLGFTDSKVAPDLAFGLQVRIPEDVSSKRIAVNVASVYGVGWPYQDKANFESYVAGYCDLVSSIALATGAEEIVLFDTNYPADAAGADRFFERYRMDNQGVRVVYQPGRRTVNELIEVCGSAQHAVVTRLHAGIIASLAGCRLFAVAYQPKVRDVLATFGISRSVIDISEVLDFDKEHFNPTSRLKQTGHGVESAHKDIDAMLRDCVGPLRS